MNTAKEACRLDRIPLEAQDQWILKLKETRYSPSPVWLKIKVKEAITGKRHLSSELPPPLSPQLIK